MSGNNLPISRISGDLKSNAAEHLKKFMYDYQQHAAASSGNANWNAHLQNNLMGALNGSDAACGRTNPAN